MTRVTIRGRLVNSVLRTSAAHHRPESENLAGGFTDKLIRSIRQNARVPQWLAFICDKNRITDFQINNRIKLSQSKRDIVWIRHCFGLRHLCRRAVTGLALNILDFFFVGMDIAIPHRLGTRMAVNAVHRVFAFRELSNRLEIILQTIDWLVCSLNECHRPQIIIAAVMARVALCVRNGRCQFMDLALRK